VCAVVVVVVVAKVGKRFLLLVDFLDFLLMGRDFFVVVILLNFYGEMLL
jgi:hypothetical protein